MQDTRSSVDNMERARSSVGLAPCDRHRILIVDDEEVIRRLFSMILSPEFVDCDINLAANGEEAVNLFREHHHAVILMDLHMPILDGQGAFIQMEKLCAENGWQMPSVVFCTGFAPTGRIKKLVEGNSPHALLAKPVSDDTLVEAIRSRL